MYITFERRPWLTFLDLVQKGNVPLNFPFLVRRDDSVNVQILDVAQCLIERGEFVEVGCE